MTTEHYLRGLDGGLDRRNLVALVVLEDLLDQLHLFLLGLVLGRWLACRGHVLVRLDCKGG